jgi:hypothetical protein
MLEERERKELKKEEQREQDKFNNDTQSTEVRNQNHTHNSKKEGLGPNTNR